MFMNSRKEKIGIGLRRIINLFAFNLIECLVDFQGNYNSFLFSFSIFRFLWFPSSQIPHLPVWIDNPANDLAIIAILMFHWSKVKT